MQAQPTLPSIKPHTEAKHDILRHHMGAWFPILGKATKGTSSPLLYIDGFAGPGEYADGDDGSPILALKVVSEHQYCGEFSAAERVVNFLFIERDGGFFNHLNRKIGEIEWPKSFHIDVRNEEFEDVIKSLLSDLESGNRHWCPTLLLVDPFGSAGFPMDLFRRMSKFSFLDVLINFNYADLIRWILPDSTKHVTLDKLYGGSRWRPALQMEGELRKSFLISEYRKTLTEIGWRGTDFEMINNQNQTQYYLIFGTRHARGMEVMKKAMRSVSPDGQFRYRDRTDPSQLRLISTGMDAEFSQELADHLYAKYRGTKVVKDTLSDEIAWHTRWIDKDLTAALKLLEDSTPPKIIDVQKSDGSRRKKGTFPPGSIITFTT